MNQETKNTDTSTRVDQLAQFFSSDVNDPVVAYLAKIFAKESAEALLELSEEIREKSSKIEDLETKLWKTENALKVEQGLVKFAERQINRLIGEKKVWQEEKLAPDKKIEDLTKIIVDTANNQLADDGEWYDLGQDDIVQKGDRYRAKVGTTYSEADVWGKPASHWDNFQFQRRKPTDMLDDGTAVPGWAKGSGSWKGWDRCVGNQAMMRIVGNNTLHVNYLGELLVRHPISGHPVPMRFGAIPAAKKAADAIIAGLEAKP